MRAPWRARKPDHWALLEDFLAGGAAAHRSEWTLRWYRSVLTPMLLQAGGLPSTPAEIERFLSRYRAAATVTSRLSAIRAFYAWLAGRGHIDGYTWLEAVRKPTHRARRLPRTFTQTELTDITNAARRDPRDFAAVLAFIDTGARLSELHSLTTGDILAASLRLRGKAGEHVVPLSTPTRSALLRITAPGTTTPVFRAARGRPISRVGFEKRIRAVIAAAGITPPKAGPHTFRHTFATAYLRNGGSIKRLQLILGHSSVTTTEIYLHLAQTDIEAEHARLSPLRDVLAAPQLTLLRSEEAG